jgi:hypothetical protein
VLIRRDLVDWSFLPRRKVEKGFDCDEFLWGFELKLQVLVSFFGIKR